MELITDLHTLRQTLALHREHRRTLALVPTMGFLHEGHLALMRQARHHADVVVTSIFVNPTQFGPNEDLAAYPRDLDRDLDLCRSAGVDLVFHPDARDVYPRPPRVLVHAPDLANRLCGLSRPGHFQGVCTVVTKLFHLVQPDVAVFGQKDFQQLAILKALVEDLNLPIAVLEGPTVREHDGLALSSRNTYLDPDARAQATAISRGLFAARDAFQGGLRDPQDLIRIVQQHLDAQPLALPEYVELVRADDLTPISHPIDAPAVIAVACRFGRTRLIDNIHLNP